MSGQPEGKAPTLNESQLQDILREAHYNVGPTLQQVDALVATIRALRTQLDALVAELAEIKDHATCEFCDANVTTREAMRCCGDCYNKTVNALVAERAVKEALSQAIETVHGIATSAPNSGSGYGTYRYKPAWEMQQDIVAALEALRDRE